MFYVQRTTSLFNDSGEQIGQVNCGERFFNLYKSGNYVLAELNFSSISEDVDPQRKNVQSVGWVLEADVVYSTAETNPINCN